MTTQPYYERDGITLFHADCREVREIVPPSRKVSLITDPPYGIKYKSTHNSHRKGEWSKWVRDENFDSIHGDDKPFNPSEWLCFPRIAMFGGNYFSSRLPDSKCWITWDKRDGIGANDFADCELVWTNFDRPSRVFRHVWSGLIRAGEENVAKQSKLHPHQKPVALMEFIIGYGCKTGDLVLDPYSGSGTTAVAAWRRGFDCICFEIDERHCEKAAKRIDAEITRGRLFSPKAPSEVQKAMFTE